MIFNDFYLTWCKGSINFTVIVVMLDFIVGTKFSEWSNSFRTKTLQSEGHDVRMIEICF